MRQLILAFASAVQSIDADNWDSLMGRDNPFVRHAYLLSLEESLSACAATGWRPHHLCVFDATGSELAPDTVIISPKDAADFMALPLLALMPLYQKSHSYGEYVFDWAWAQAYERHGLEYYPKLLNAIPFTPVQGRRMGLSPTLLAEEAQQLSLAVLSCLNGQLANADTPMSSWHSLFVSSSQQALFTEGSNHTALRRLSTQFHWHNRGYKDFAAFLAALTSRKRKNILKERAQLQPYGLQYEFVAGAEISSQQWQHFIECYQLTYLKRSGHRGYLTPTFFT